jgi:hypothetical protein
MGPNEQATTIVGIGGRAQVGRLVTLVSVAALVLLAAPVAQAGRHHKHHRAHHAGAAQQPQPPVNFAWAGDIAFSRKQGLPPNGGRHVFDSVAKYLASPGYMLGNLEGTLGRGGSSKCGGGSGGNCFAFQAPASFAQLFKRVGFDLMNLANNHSRDYGTIGLNQTLKALRRARLPHTGLPGEITVRNVDGTKVAFLGFAPYPWASDLTNIPRARRLVAKAGRMADLVIVMIHAGAEGTGATHTPHGAEHAFGENRGRTRAFAHAVVTTGADAVLGSGPHVLRGIECYRHRLIAYSLGNFAGYRTLSTGGVLSLSGVLRLQLDHGGKLVQGTLLPVRLQPPGVPKRDKRRASIALVRRLSRQDFGKRSCRITKSGKVSLP